MKVPKGAPRVNQQPAFILHQYPYRETSRLLDVFSRDHGRLMLVARGVQRHGSQLRSVLLGHQPLLLDWFGSGEVRTLHAAVWQPGIAQLRGVALVCGLYANELLQRVLLREFQSAELFSDYYQLVKMLAQSEAQPAVMESALRRFEVALLASQGVAIDWRNTSAEGEVRPDLRYAFTSERGLHATPGGVAAGETMLAFASSEMLLGQPMLEMKLLLRQVLNSTLLDSENLQTRGLMRDIQRLTRSCP